MSWYRSALCAVFLAALAACQSPVASPVTGPSVTRNMYDLISFQNIASRIAPVAKAMCAEQNPNKPASFCDFDFQIVGTSYSFPNATQSIGADGRPVITMTPSLLENAQNDDEIAFVIAHEVSHQIADHLGRALGFSNQNANGFSIGQASGKTLELEADAIAVLVSSQAGFDPEVGSKAIARFGRTFGRPSTTHPTVQERVEVVNRVLKHLSNGDTISLN